MNDLLKELQGIENFNHISFEIENEELYWEIERKVEAFSCSNCNSKNVTATFIKTRNIRCLSMGKLKTNLKVRHHRIRCHDCQNFLMEELKFLPKQNCHYTKDIVKEVILLRNEMTLSATGRYLGLGWGTTKKIEKEYLKEKYKSVDFNGVETIGIDEVYIGRKSGFITIVRDLVRGRVLFIGDGKSGASLDPFAEQLKEAGVTIKNVAVDLANSFSAWITKKLPNATIIYDKFHVIKLMNDKLNSVRRETMNELCEEDKKALKGKRFFLLRNIESLSNEKKEELNNIRKTYFTLGEMSMMKECLRNIYSIAEHADQARTAFTRWAELAMETGIKELKTMAKTIKKRLNGLIAYWKDGITSAGMEGFNNKIGALNRQAYGYRDLEYFKLKIFDLPKSRIENV